MSLHAYQVGAGSVVGVATGVGNGVSTRVGVASSARDLRLASPDAGSGVIADRVMYRATPESPEAPFATARVWMLRCADGYKAWEGWTDAAGHYTATNLEPGVEYIAVGIDPFRGHQAAGAGPVVAVKAGA